VEAFLGLIKGIDRKHLHIKMLLVMDQRPASSVAKKLNWSKSIEWRTNWDQDLEYDKLLTEDGPCHSISNAFKWPSR
jgi:hypothetical protein